MLNRYVKEVPELAWDIIDLSEKPTTIIYPEAAGLPPVLQSDKGIAIRMVKNGFLNKLITRYRKPLISTSPNISGQSTPSSFHEISPEILNQADYVINLPEEKNRKAQPSAILRLGYHGEIEIIRK
jgi:L-threonylcarbamoyladenylate synthase